MSHTVFSSMCSLRQKLEEEVVLARKLFSLKQGRSGVQS